MLAGSTIVWVEGRWGRDHVAKGTDPGRAMTQNGPIKAFGNGAKSDLC